MSKVIDMTGQKISHLTVLQRVDNTLYGNAQWLCRCDCGNTCIVLGQYLRNGKVKSCGCYQKTTGQSNFKDITGTRFGKLVVLDFIKFDDNHHSIWKCQCDCGNIIEVSKPNLTSGSTRSCGCLKQSSGEYVIEQFLKANNITYQTEYSFNDLKSDKNYVLRFDFYLPTYKLLIEYDGIQHTKDVPFLNSQLIQHHDQLKNQYCIEHNLSLLRISYLEFSNIEQILKENLKLR